MEGGGDQVVPEAGEWFPLRALRLVFTKCSPRAHTQAQRPEEQFPRAFIYNRLLWWAKVVSNHRPPACKDSVPRVTYCNY